jgi:hypothetical protein
MKTFPFQYYIPANMPDKTCNSRFREGCDSLEIIITFEVMFIFEQK